MPFRRKKSLIDRAQDYVEHVSDSVRPQLEAAFEQAVDKAGPALQDARDRAKPLIADGKTMAAEKAAAGAALAADRAALGRDLATAKVAEIKGEPESKSGGKLKKLLLLGGIAAVVAFVASKLKASNDNSNWQSSYVPTPPPAPKPAAPAPAPASDDTAGGAPGEALSDAAEEPHAPTTPDAPAEVIDVEDVPSSDKP